MNRVLVLILSLVTMSGWGQTSEEMDNKVRLIWRDLDKNVKYRDEQISYHAQIFIGACNYEVLINDFPIDIYFGPANGASNGSHAINTAILKSGVQNWKIRVYPIHDRERIDGNPYDISRPLIEEGARVEFSVEALRFRDEGGVDILDNKVFAFSAPLVTSEKNGSNVFADAGKPYVEYSGTFIAKVPYELKGWSESVDLSKEKREKLTEEVEVVYNKYRNWMQNRQLDKIAESKLNAEKERAQVLFYTRADNEQHTASFIKMAGQSGIQMLPIEKSKIKFYGNGRVIALERSDVLELPSLIGEYEENGRMRMRYLYIYFHRPYPGAPLEVIR